MAAAAARGDAPTTTITYMREGRPVRLLQGRSKSGIPLCVECSRPIPAAYRGWFERFGRPAWFCTDACSIKFAQAVAAECWVVR